MNNKTNPKIFRRKRRGVGAIIGGVILAGIILTSVLTFFVTILQNEKARTSYEIQSQQVNGDKGTEVYEVNRNVTIVNGAVSVGIDNTGSIPMVASHALLYCSSCADPGKPIQDQDVTSVLNPGDTQLITVGGVSGAMMTTTNNYTISVISERGNIISSTTCTVTSDGRCPQDDDAGDDGEDALDDISQGTGSVQLDFESFAAIFPDFTTRDGIDQTGRYVSASDVMGYPANNLYGDVNTIIVQRVRNLDADDDLRLTKNTAMITAFGGTKGNHPKPVFLCSSTDDNDPSTRTPITLPPTAYSNNVLLERVPAPYDIDAGWHNLYFCRAGDGSGNPTGAIDGWKPDSDYSLGINPIFMVMRAKLEGTQLDYAQTIPYQAFQLNGATDGTIQTFVACSYATNVQTDCQQQTAALGASPPPYDYTVTRGVPFYIHLGVSHTGTATNQAYGATPYTVQLIHPDGSHTTLSSAVAWNDATFRNIQVTIPAGTTPTPEYYTLKVTDSSDVAGSSQQAVFMTVRVT